LHEAKNNLSELNRRLHELEIELRRLENEREELTAAYKEAEAVRFADASRRRPPQRYIRGPNKMFCGLQGRKAEELRVQRLTSEFGVFRHEAEKRLAEKDEEIECIRWVLS